MEIMQLGIRKRLEAIAKNGAYTDDDFRYFESLYFNGEETIRKELRSILGVPADYEVIKA